MGRQADKKLVTPAPLMRYDQAYDGGFETAVSEHTTRLRFWELPAFSFAILGKSAPAGRSSLPRLVLLDRKHLFTAGSPVVVTLCGATAAAAGRQGGGPPPHMGMPQSTALLVTYCCASSGRGGAGILGFEREGGAYVCHHPISSAAAVAAFRLVGHGYCGRERREKASVSLSPLSAPN